jgi:hypothetical protein
MVKQLKLKKIKFQKKGKQSTTSLPLPASQNENKLINFVLRGFVNKREKHTSNPAHVACENKS